MAATRVASTPTRGAAGSGSRAACATGWAATSRHTTGGCRRPHRLRQRARAASSWSPGCGSGGAAVVARVRVGACGARDVAVETVCRRSRSRSRSRAPEVPTTVYYTLQPLLPYSAAERTRAPTRHGHAPAPTWVANAQRHVALAILHSALRGPRGVCGGVNVRQVGCCTPHAFPRCGAHSASRPASAGGPGALSRVSDTVVYIGRRRDSPQCHLSIDSTRLS
eukprot:5125924-Prymnesium_polylepis.1